MRVRGGEPKKKKKRIRNEVLGHRPRAEVPPGSQDRREKSPENRAEELRRQRFVLQRRNQGVPEDVIAEHLGVDERTVSRIYNRALEAYAADHKRALEQIVRRGQSVRDALRRTWMIRATGGELEVEGPDGARTRQRIEPDEKAARVILRLQRDEDMLLQHMQPLRVEHTGAGGGPILTAEADPAEKARAIRMAFRERALGHLAPKDVVIVDGGPSPTEQH